MKKTEQTGQMLKKIFVRSDQVVAREIEGEIIIVPLAAGVGRSDEELFTLNETGRAIWQKIDGTRRLGEVVRELAARYRAPVAVVGKDVVGLVRELVKRKMLAERPKG